MKIAKDWKIRPADLLDYFGLTLLYEIVLDYWEYQGGREDGQFRELIAGLIWNHTCATTVKNSNKLDQKTTWQANRNLLNPRAKDVLDRMIDQGFNLFAAEEEGRISIENRKQARVRKFNLDMYEQARHSRKSKGNRKGVSKKWLAQLALQSL